MNVRNESFYDGLFREMRLSICFLILHRGTMRKSVLYTTTAVRCSICGARSQRPKRETASLLCLKSHDMRIIKYYCGRNSLFVRNALPGVSFGKRGFYGISRRAREYSNEVIIATIKIVYAVCESVNSLAIRERELTARAVRCYPNDMSRRSECKICHRRCSCALNYFG